MSEPERGRAYRFSLTLIAVATGSLLANPPLASGDFQVSQDGGTLATLATLPTVSPTGSQLVAIQLTATGMKAAEVAIVGHAPDGVWEDVVIVLQPTETLGTDHRVLLSANTQPVLPADLVALNGNAASPPILDRSARTMARGIVTTGA